jgi:pullulanase-type alpha-1,6-glucosidase
VAAVADRDAFNWGYDPWHYTVPEGSYSTQPDGSARVLEFREMVQGLAGLGLRTVMDVVYNHTTASGQTDKSVLDRVVPGYYYRLDDNGIVEKDSCCDDTASEHRMMEKLLIDSVLTWAKQYKVDGFRFDIMGFHMKSNMVKLRQALDALTPARDGVDGKRIYLYGEGWNFGHVADNALGVNATQANMAGTGIGTFNDRLRDGARGGGPFSGIQEQGFLTGLSYDPNATNQGTSADQQSRLLQEEDWVRVGLAGNLASYAFEDRTGTTRPASEIDYNGQKAGYTADPQEVINYIDAHDNDTLFDAIQVKAPVATAMSDRVRMENLGTSLLALGQGIPFFHAGVELLRSKSGDRNSYNSGDWFNKLDFTYQDDNWGVGLPPARDNQANWDILRPLLGNPALHPSSADIHAALDHFEEALAIRRSSPLFRLRSAADVQARLRFFNTGPSQIPGVIGLTLSDDTGAVDRHFTMVASVINACDQGQTVPAPSLAGRPLVLHPLQAASTDPVVRTARFAKATGSFSVPARTAAVFVANRPPADQTALLRGDVQALVASGALKKGEGTALSAILSSAERQMRLSNLRVARVELGAFVLAVEALERTRQLGDADGDPLQTEARYILGLIGDDGR